ncbi:hypothetical protein PNOK_0250700 [Pyrrhoderma noxium]|uniref:Uncharacterized protein n=1 Tax=Pyrrhoderma noxium TaxID=2282107 RepID=A0A286USI2_9AGAM|nr:hypothetical protein PNOK_0250700 [Pyrrhoderma noxium]
MPVNNNGNGAMNFGTYNDVNGNQNNVNTYNDQRKNNNNYNNYNNQRIAHGKNVINGDIKDYVFSRSKSELDLKTSFVESDQVHVPVKIYDIVLPMSWNIGAGGGCNIPIQTDHAMTSLSASPWTQNGIILKCNSIQVGSTRFERRL